MPKHGAGDGHDDAEQTSAGALINTKDGTRFAGVGSERLRAPGH